MTDRAHARAEVPDAGDDQGVGREHDGRLAGDDGVAADGRDRTRDRVQVARAVVEHGDLGHRVPFVEGTPPRPVRLHASPSAFAMALNSASQMWCGERPYRRCTWIVRFGRLRERAHEVLEQAGVEPVDRLVRGPAPRGSRSCGPQGPARPRRPPRRAARRSRRTVAPRPCRPAPRTAPAPTAMPQSSTVWWPSTCRSPLHVTSKSHPACLPNCCSM